MPLLLPQLTPYHQLWNFDNFVCPHWFWCCSWAHPVGLFEGDVFSDDATQSMLDHDTRKRLCKKLRRVVAEKRTAMASLLEISNIGLFGLWFQNR